jgi:hypothetical protein
VQVRKVFSYKVCFCFYSESESFITLTSPFYRDMQGNSTNLATLFSSEQYIVTCTIGFRFFVRSTTFLLEPPCSAWYRFYLIPHIAPNRAALAPLERLEGFFCLSDKKSDDMIEYV